MRDSYAIGTAGVPWGEIERQTWRRAQSIKRSYLSEVVERLAGLEADFKQQTYGNLGYPEGKYPLVGMCSRNWNSALPNVLVTGGVHGYETSGVQGAIRFLAEAASRYTGRINLVVVPCVSPWGYETINRWNPEAVDPNRSFYEGSPARECALLIRWIDSLWCSFLAHFDLHETTDTDNSEFRPALGARDGVEQDVWDIPDGFYCVGDTEAPEAGFQKAVVDAVSQVTHIAAADTSGRLIGVPIEQHGVINYPAGKLGLCAGLTDARYRTTTEVYPDSPRVDDENCIQAQIAAVCGGLDYLLQ